MVLLVEQLSAIMLNVTHGKMLSDRPYLSVQVWSVVFLCFADQFP